MGEQPALQPHPETALARLAQGIIDKRGPQQELYKDITFSQDHLVGQSKAIPALVDHFIFSPGHLDALYRQGLIPRGSLYKITQTQLQEGMQKGHTMTIAKKRPLEELAGKTIYKEPDAVYANVKLQDLLENGALTNPVNQALVLYMIDHQLGNISIPGFLAGMKKEYQHTPVPQRQLIREDAQREMARRIVQYQAVDRFLDGLGERFPSAANILDLGGKTTYMERIRDRLSKDLGTAGERINITDVDEFAARRVSESTKAA